jgi:hypothetical protein
MAFKLTRQDSAQLGELMAKAADVAGTLETSIAKFNEIVAEHFASLREALDAYNQAQADVRTFIEETHQSLEDEFSDKSEKWQDGERGQAVREFIDEWQQVAGDITDVEIEEPTAIEVDLPDWTNYELREEV